MIGCAARFCSIPASPIVEGWQRFAKTHVVWRVGGLLYWSALTCSQHYPLHSSRSYCHSSCSLWQFRPSRSLIAKRALVRNLPRLVVIWNWARAIAIQAFAQLIHLSTQALLPSCSGLHLSFSDANFLFPATWLLGHCLPAQLATLPSHLVASSHARTNLEEVKAQANRSSLASVCKNWWRQQRHGMPWALTSNQTCHRPQLNWQLLVSLYTTLRLWPSQPFLAARPRRANFVSISALILSFISLK